jgi:hypothetical protein
MQKVQANVARNVRLEILAQVAQRSYFASVTPGICTRTNRGL